MAFLSRQHNLQPKRPLFVGILANTMLSTVPGLSGAGPNPTGSLMVPVLDAELIWQGKITSTNATPNTKTGCPTPATITRAVLDLAKIKPLFINAGLVHQPTVPALSMQVKAGGDPRKEKAVPEAIRLYEDGIRIGNLLSAHDVLIIGECVPGGTTTALCLLRALGYDAKVSSASVKNPDSLKENVWKDVLTRISTIPKNPLDIVCEMGDPMMAVAVGIVNGFPGNVFLAGGTQMLAVAGIIKALGIDVPEVVTTVYVRDDPNASCEKTARDIGTSITYVDPGFGEIGHSGLVRYCIGEVKEGMGCGGAMMLGYLMNHSEEEIRDAILTFVSGYSS
ncbi:MAG: TIGR00303 family protein [Methanomicrobiales archaeon]|nr:TIGR00303 family protein [Methanomicrobiales archaeon]